MGVSLVDGGNSSLLGKTETFKLSLLRAVDCWRLQAGKNKILKQVVSVKTGNENFFKVFIL